MPCLPVLPRTMLGVWLGPKVCIRDSIKMWSLYYYSKILKRFFLTWIFQSQCKFASVKADSSSMLTHTTDLVKRHVFV